MLEKTGKIRFCTHTKRAGFMRKKTPTDQKPMDIALRMLSQRALSEHELRTRLLAREISAEVIDGILPQLKKWGYLNEQTLREQLTREADRRGKGSLWLKQKCYTRQISSDDHTPTNDIACLDTPERAHAALLRKYGEQYAHDDRSKRRSFAYLQRQGFSMDVIFKALARQHDREI